LKIIVKGTVEAPELHVDFKRLLKIKLGLKSTKPEEIIKNLIKKKKSDEKDKVINKLKSKKEKLEEKLKSKLKNKLRKLLKF